MKIRLQSSWCCFGLLYFTRKRSETLPWLTIASRKYWWNNYEKKLIFWWRLLTMALFLNNETGDQTNHNRCTRANQVLTSLSKLWPLLGLCNMYRSSIPYSARLPPMLNTSLCNGKDLSSTSGLFTDQEMVPTSTFKSALVSPPALSFQKATRNVLRGTDGCTVQI